MSRSFRMRYRDVSETKMAFQTLATFTDIVQSNHRSRNATVLRLLNAKRFHEHAHKPLVSDRSFQKR